MTQLDVRAVIGTDHEGEAVKAVAAVLTSVLAKPGDELNPNQLALDYALAKKVMDAARPLMVAAERERCALGKKLAAEQALLTADEVLSLDGLGTADMTLSEAGEQIGILVASLRHIADLLRDCTWGHHA